jgi:hypothetical protein
VLRTTIRHGHLNIELCEDGALQLARDDRPESIRLSGSEWIYLQKLAVLHGWPMAPPMERREE